MLRDVHYDSPTHVRQPEMVVFKLLRLFFFFFNRSYFTKLPAVTHYFSNCILIAPLHLLRAEGLLKCYASAAGEKFSF